MIVWGRGAYKQKKTLEHYNELTFVMRQMFNKYQDQPPSAYELPPGAAPPGAAPCPPNGAAPRSCSPELRPTSCPPTSFVPTLRPLRHIHITPKLVNNHLVKTRVIPQRYTGNDNTQPLAALMLVSKRETEKCNCGRLTVGASAAWFPIVTRPHTPYPSPIPMPRIPTGIFQSVGCLRRCSLEASISVFQSVGMESKFHKSRNPCPGRCSGALQMHPCPGRCSAGRQSWRGNWRKISGIKKHRHRLRLPTMVLRQGASGRYGEGERPMR